MRFLRRLNRKLKGNRTRIFNILMLIIQAGVATAAILTPAVQAFFMSQPERGFMVFAVLTSIQTFGNLLLRQFTNTPPGVSSAQTQVNLPPPADTSSERASPINQ